MGLTLIDTTGAISACEVEITGLDDSYAAYEFHFYNLHPSAAYASWVFQVNTSYNQNINSTALRTYANETHATTHDAARGYQTGADTHVGASSGTFCPLNDSVNNGNATNALSVVMTLYDPSSTRYSKHFISKTDAQTSSTYQQYTQVAGYIKTQSAVDRIKFKFASGDIDAGEIKWFGYS